MTSAVSCAPRLYSPPDGLTFAGSSEDEGNDETSKTRITYSDANSDFRVKHWSFPKLDDEIRQCIEEYGGVFPKLNFSSPKVNCCVPFFQNHFLILVYLSAFIRTHIGFSLMRIHFDVFPLRTFIFSSSLQILSHMTQTLLMSLVAASISNQEKRKLITNLNSFYGSGILLNEIAKFDVSSEIND